MENALLSQDEYYLKYAEIIAEDHGACRRRKIGCILTDIDHKPLALEANGRPDVLGSCMNDPCPDAHVPAGAGAKGCYALHAEMKALMQCDPEMVFTAYSTKAPCTACVISLLQTGCQRIVFRTASNEQTNRQLWEKAGRKWIQLPKE